MHISPETLAFSKGLRCFGMHNKPQPAHRKSCDWRNKFHGGKWRETPFARRLRKAVAGNMPPQQHTNSWIAFDPPKLSTHLKVRASLGLNQAAKLFWTTKKNWFRGRGGQPFSIQCHSFQHFRRQPSSCIKSAHSPAFPFFKRTLRCQNGSEVLAFSSPSHKPVFRAISP